MITYSPNEIRNGKRASRIRALDKTSAELAKRRKELKQAELTEYNKLKAEDMESYVRLKQYR